MEIIISATHITNIKVFVNLPNKNYHIKKKIKFAGFLKWEIKEHISFCSMIDKGCVDSFESKYEYYDKSKGVVIYKPHCDITLVNGKKESFFFETEDELFCFLDEVKNKIGTYIVQ